MGDKRTIIVKHPANKISESERNRVLQICCSDEYKNMTPNEIVPKMAEKGLFIASEATFYRILKASGLSQTEFCRQHNLDGHYFSKWKSKLEPTKAETSFMEIPFKSVKSSEGAGLNIGLSVRANGEIVISISR